MPDIKVTKSSEHLTQRIVRNLNHVLLHPSTVSVNLDAWNKTSVKKL